MKKTFLLKLFIVLSSIAVLTVVFVDPPTVSVQANEWKVTYGTASAGNISKGSQTIEGSSYLKVACDVSHFGYGSPVAGYASALNMYVGNTSVQSRSSASTVTSTGNQSCDGGVLDKSSFGLPAVYDEQNNVIAPSGVSVYYNDYFDSQNINKMPQSLQLVAAQRYANCGGDCISAYNSKSFLRLRVQFANCLQIDQSGNPVLRSVSQTHGVYSTSGCPQSHPYHIPAASMHISYPIKYEDSWKLSTDFIDNTQQNPKGSTIQAYMVSAWSEEGQDAMLECHQENLKCVAVTNTEEPAEGSSSEEDTNLGPLPPQIGMDAPVVEEELEESEEQQPEPEPVVEEEEVEEEEEEQTEEESAEEGDTTPEEELEPVVEEEVEEVEEKKVAVVLKPEEDAEEIRTVITEPVQETAKSIAKTVLKSIPNPTDIQELKVNTILDDIIEEEEKIEALIEDDLKLEISDEELEKIEINTNQRFNPFNIFSKKKKEFVYEVKDDQVIIIEDQAPEDLERPKKRKRVSHVMEYISEAVVQML